MWCPLPEIDFICLANSRKLGGRCIAGIQIQNNEWIRPVSNFPEGSLVSQHYTLDTGNAVALLDVVRINVREPKPELTQPENWILADSRWRHIRTLSANEAFQSLESLIDSGPVLLGNTTDRININSLAGQSVNASLTLINPRSLRWHITTSLRGSRQTRAQFDVGGQCYNIAVTDPLWHSKLGELTIGNYQRNVCGLRPSDRILFTVSLGKPMTNGECFKLVAGVIVLPEG